MKKILCGLVLLVMVSSSYANDTMRSLSKTRSIQIERIKKYQLVLKNKSLDERTIKFLKIKLKKSQNDLKSTEGMISLYEEMNNIDYNQSIVKKF